MNIALLGTGLMGTPLARRLLAAGHNVLVYNRSSEKALPLVQAGAQVSDFPALAVSGAEVVITMLSDADALRQVLLDANVQAELADKLVINMATIAPGEAREIQAQVAAAGGEFMEAPVLGSIPEATQGTLQLMVGATEAQFERALPVLQCFGEAPLLVGPVGQGAALKLAMNQLIASLTTAFSLSLGLVQKEGVPVETFMAICRDSALYAPTYDKKLARMLERHFGQPNFPLKHLLKDVDLFRRAATEDGLDDSLLEGIQQILHKALDQGEADSDYSALYNAVVPRNH